ncbi:MAG: efflux RND transporter periplasmic adaptor subunit [Syntrophomonas sp.]|nr:efflux RND transporter periplasmic adaptor subunit [Syntrophomonas sp.]
MEKNLWKPLVIFLLLLLAGGSYWVYMKYFTAAEYSLSATGTIEATTVALHTKSVGTITSMDLKEGDLVAKDQLLAVLNRSDLTAQKERDALGVLVAEAKLADLGSGARGQEVKEAIANVNIAQINLDQAGIDLDRLESLFNEGALSQLQLDQARVNFNLKKNLLEVAQARLSLLQEGTRPSQVSGAAAEVERSTAVLKATESMLEDMKIYSPIAGTILSKHYEPREFVQMGVPLATIADLSRLWIKVYIPTDDLPAVKLGQTVHFTISGDNTQYSGLVTHIASQGEFTPKTIQTKQERTNVVFAVKISVDNQSGVLKPGMPADVIFERI